LATVIFWPLVPELEARWLTARFADRKVHGSNPTSASRFPPSRLGQPGSISDLTQLRWSLPSSWMGTPRRVTSTVRDIVRHGPVAPSMALMHPSYCLQCIAPFPIPRRNSPLTVVHLRTNLSAPASNAQLPTSPPQIIGGRNCGSYNHCRTSTRGIHVLLLPSEEISLLSLVSNHGPVVCRENQIHLQISVFVAVSPFWVQVEHKVDGNSGTVPT
ncbi:hypothetical protein CSKR_109720, partial [Clonorchis sinensis]